MNCSTTGPGVSLASALAWSATLLLVACVVTCVVAGEIIGRRLRATRRRNDPPYERLLDEAVGWEGGGESVAPLTIDANTTRI